MPATPLQGSPPPGLLEGYVQLPPDSTGKQLRAFPVAVYEQQADGTFASVTAYQQALVLADADGNLIGVQGSPVIVSDPQLAGLLKDIRDELRMLRERLED